MSDVTLRDYIESRIGNDQAVTNERLLSLKREIEKASDVLNLRLAIMQDRVLATETRMRTVEDYQTNQTGQLWAFGVSMTLLWTVLTFAMNRWMRRP